MADTRFVRSRVKTDPAKLPYYQRKYAGLNTRIYALVAESDALPPDDALTAEQHERIAEIWRQVDKLHDQRAYYAVQIAVAQGMIGGAKF